MNRLILIGNLCADPELRTTVSGKSVCNFRLAVSRRHFGSQQQQQQQDSNQPEADFFSVVCWNGTAENCAKYLAKGRKVCVIGSVSQRTFDGKDGTRKAIMEVNASDVEFITSASQAGAQPPAPPSSALPNGAIYADPGDEGEELPF